MGPDLPAHTHTRTHAHARTRARAHARTPCHCFRGCLSCLFLLWFFFVFLLPFWFKAVLIALNRVSKKATQRKTNETKTTQRKTNETKNNTKKNKQIQKTLRKTNKPTDNNRQDDDTPRPPHHTHLPRRPSLFPFFYISLFLSFCGFQIQAR